MHKTAPVLVLTSSSTSTPRILLVKSQSGWGAPVGAEGEDVSALIQRVTTGVLHPGAAVRVVPGYHKTLHPETEDLEATVALTANEEVRPFLESDEWYDARFSSFEEASHILQASQEKLLFWCERVIPKIFSSQLTA